MIIILYLMFTKKNDQFSLKKKKITVETFFENSNCGKYNNFIIQYRFHFLFDTIYQINEYLKTNLSTIIRRKMLRNFKIKFKSRQLIFSFFKMLKILSSLGHVLFEK